MNLKLDKKLASMLRAYLKIEQIAERDWKKWTPTQQSSTVLWLAGEAKEQLADKLLELFRAQYPQKRRNPRSRKGARGFGNQLKS